MRLFNSTFLNLTVLILSASAHADGGVSHGGGDNLAAHFSQVGQRLGNVFQMICGTPRYKGTPLCALEPKFFEVTRSPHVVGLDEVISPADGKPRDAGPDGAGGIDLSKPVWTKLINDNTAVERAVSLCAHEFMILAGGERTDEYTASPQLLSALKDQLIDLNALLGKAPDNTENFDLTAYQGEYSTYQPGICNFEIQVSGNRMVLSFIDSTANHAGGCETFPSLVYFCNTSRATCHRVDMSASNEKTAASFYASWGDILLITPGRDATVLLNIQGQQRKAVRN